MHRFFPRQKDADVGATDWTREVFFRAYCVNDGPFARLCQRLELGFSVLAYVPGSCMNAAADYVQRNVGCRGQWQIYGDHPGENATMEAAWEGATSVVKRLQEWLTGARGRPDAIFKNLDRLFMDNNDGVIQNPGAQIALFSLIESTRGARTLGLVDRTFGKLPESVEAAFAERIWIDEIDAERFAGLIPEELAEKLAPPDARDLSLPEGLTWQLASRLRWSDPIRAAMIMRSIAKSSAGGAPDVLEQLQLATRPIDFLNPREVFSGDPQSVERGLAPETLTVIYKSLISRYRRLAASAASGRESSSQLHSLLPGVILYGPPGTGKTHLAKWVARQVNLPVRVVSGAELRVKEFGGTERNIVKLFRDARRAAPCVLVLDDADDLLVARSEAQGSVAGAERAIVNTMLQELAGFGGRLAGVLVILTTNRYEHLDEAIQGRVPLHVPVPYPTTPDQIRELVQTFARQYGYELAGPIVERLTQRFWEPVIRHAQFPTPRSEEDRKPETRFNLFSPREIQFAVQLLEGDDADDHYRPTDKDVDRLIEHYEQLASSPEKQAQIERRLRAEKSDSASAL